MHPQPLSVISQRSDSGYLPFAAAPFARPTLEKVPDAGNGQGEAGRSIEPNLHKFGRLGTLKRKPILIINKLNL